MLTLVVDGGREKRRQVPGMIGSPVYIPLSIMTQGGRIFPGKGTTTEDALPVCVWKDLELPFFLSSFIGVYRLAPCAARENMQIHNAHFHLHQL